MVQPSANISHRSNASTRTGTFKLVNLQWLTLGIVCAMVYISWTRSLPVSFNEHTLNSFLPISVLSSTNSSIDSDQLVYQSALSTLSCFVTPHCFPRYTCAHGSPAKLQRNKVWEQMSFCTDDLKSRQEQLQKMAQNCLVYSFGIAGSTDWEEKVAKWFGCEVHAFDPTVDHNDTELVKFHKLGLQGSGAIKTTNGIEYGAIDPARLLSLGDIMMQLGHEERKVDVLMMDCEGCEWGAIHQLACTKEGGSNSVGQMIVEGHFQKVLGLATEADVLMAADAINCLRHDGWGIVTHEGSGCDHRDGHYVRGVQEVLYDQFFLMYTSLQRVPPAQRKERLVPRNSLIQFDEHPVLDMSQTEA